MASSSGTSIPPRRLLITSPWIAGTLNDLYFRFEALLPWAALIKGLLRSTGVGGDLFEQGVQVARPRRSLQVRCSQLLDAPPLITATAEDSLARRRLLPPRCRLVSAERRASEYGSHLHAGEPAVLPKPVPGTRLTFGLRVIVADSALAVCQTCRMSDTCDVEEC